MASKKQNRPGGVKTMAGKQISCLNSTRHGILASLKSLYDDDDFDHLKQVYLEEYKPVGNTEHLLVEIIISCYIKLKRIAKAESEHIRSYFEPTDDGLFHINVTWNDKGYKPLLPRKAVEELYSVHSRYETTILNKLFRTLHELERLQRQRKGEAVSAPIAIDHNLIK